MLSTNEMNNKVKVLIFPDYGGSIYTKEMRDIVNKTTGIESRVGEIINYVETNAVHYNDYLEALQAVFNNPDLIVQYRIDGKTKYAVWGNNMHNSCSFEIVEVDTTRPWCIVENEETLAESIKYLDERKLVNKELNYWE